MNFRTTFTVAALVSASLAFASQASAATVTQLIHFDDASNGDKDYTTDDGNFFFDPTNLQSSSLCADSTSGGNGSCVIEGKQGVLPEMTRLTGDKKFTLDSFYFLLTGRGTASENELTVTDSDGKSQNFLLGSIYSFVTNYETGLAAGALAFNTGYVANLSSLTGFKNITSVQFGAASSAQVRLDCVVATFDGTTTEPLSSFSKGCGTDGGGVTTPVPLPAGLPLLLSGMALAGVVARRKSRKA
jgi:hypothetical protein